MRPRFLRHTPFILFCALALFVLLIEMRPGRFYFITTFLLFQDSLMHLLLYLVLFAFSVASLLLLLFNRSKILYRVTLAHLLPCLLISLTYRFITGYNFMYSDAVLAWNNLPLLDTALQNYGGQAALAFLATILVIIAINWLRKKAAWRSASWTACFLPLAAIAAFTMIKRTTGVVDDFPALYRVPLTVIAVVTDQLPQPLRTPVPVPPESAGVPHLFLIVDESITATELTLHQPELKTTPFLYSVRRQLLDFGVASSTTNQSAGSNIALMSGTRPTELPDTAYRTFSRTNIFQFAQKAGYITYYIDAQLGGDVLQNFMSPEDLKYIDHMERPAFTHPQAPYYDRDMLVADQLAHLAKSPKKVFAYVVKAGAHWPYARTYPADSTFFKPVLSPRSIYKDQARTLNTYHNSLRWTVDQFWRKLMGTISPQDSTVIFYTSDHGQNLAQSGISITHASVQETSPQEAAVPLWIWDPGKLTGIPSSPKPRWGYSHFHVFPALLRLQGFSPNWVQKQYGPSFWDDSANSASKRFFLAGDLFGRGPHSLVPFR
ncbi:sulfatase-like hydrolase/transferase [Rufibacter roseolus]|uniref:sulfatase-like hydrolase/transferase n=1 Tax=Rufibacter roseolus TaxID=2817375 RepID=UPI001B30FA1E|nr:sulfatase-like hydrolase/transferase [Rufibacter roseolus]